MELIKAKTIISKNKDTSWFGSDYNMNIYKGCSHGCIYCDSRSNCYRVKNFDQVKVKENALELIYEELKGKREKGVIGTGSMSDPYNPMEKELLLTKGALELIDRNGFGVFVITKSDLIIRDISLYQRIQKHSPVLCTLTVTTCEDELCKKIEQRVVPTSKRMEALRKLSEAGIPTGILLTPILPFINDTEENITEIIKMAHENGVKYIYPSFGVTLRENQMEYYFDKLDQLFIGLKQEYIEEYHGSYFCKSRNADELYKVFHRECKRYGILYTMKDIISDYKKNYLYEQISLF